MEMEMEKRIIKWLQVLPEWTWTCKDVPKCEQNSKWKKCENKKKGIHAQEETIDHHLKQKNKKQNNYVKVAHIHTEYTTNIIIIIIIITLIIPSYTLGVSTQTFQFHSLEIVYTFQCLKNIFMFTT